MQLLTENLNLILSLLLLILCLSLIWFFFIPKKGKKFLIHLLTRKSEIERIIKKKPHAKDVISFWSSLKQSQHFSKIVTTIGYGSFNSREIIEEILEQKKIKNDQLVEKRLKGFLIQIHLFNETKRKLIGLQETSYDCKNQEHEMHLQELWCSMKPDTTFERKSKQWSKLGFQGKDPATDFRGSGILGLFFLEYFSKKYPEESKKALNDSYGTESRSFYPFSCFGIQLSNELLQNLKKTDRLDSYLLMKKPELATFFTLCSELFIKFNQLWKKKNPENLLKFPSLFKSFFSDSIKNL
ncbi:hypothetical protein M0813_29498 [Anaeramoeba flamelloides]|uniref:ELMO domain-containing protein n=1 Tax=Anaeramoeba flamelloides TaxID=1746091 RepID=A0AAV7ZAR3_9EUKA|nr:hypothetical protein M0812_17364 [Anaeramoeba flamelloides]KAJ6233822.1 hypothetical protein M0813_29498 [Anaeramoeba flamelloides]